MFIILKKQNSILNAAQCKEINTLGKRLIFCPIDGRDMSVQYETEEGAVTALSQIAKALERGDNAISI